MRFVCARVDAHGIGTNKGVFEFMKVAIIGGGAAGLLASREFSQLGAEVVLFAKGALGGGIRRLSGMAPDLSMGDSTVGEYWKNTLEPLSRDIQSHIRIKNVRVLRIHKSFLGVDEVPEKGSRLIDLFRLVWSQDDLEVYEDFDIAIEAKGFFHRPLPAGPGCSLALNEERRECEGWVSKSWQIFEHIGRLSGKERVLLVGSGASAMLVCQQFFSRYPGGKLDLVTTEKEPFDKAGGEGQYPELFQWVQSRMEESYRRWKKFRHKDILPDFCIYNGHNVVSIDKLEDRDNLFVTIEAPAFRGGKERVKTLSVEGALVATGFERVPAPSEPGHYHLSGHIPEITRQIQEVKADVLSFFSQN